MKKYIFMRVLRSLLSIFLVTTLTYTIIYTMVPRKLIFKQDTNYNKIATTPDKRDNYENTVYERMGYIEYYDTKELQEKASTMDSSVTVDANERNTRIKIYFFISFPFKIPKEPSPHGEKVLLRVIYLT